VLVLGMLTAAPAPAPAVDADTGLPLPRWIQEDGIVADPATSQVPLGSPLLPRDQRFIQEMEGAEGLMAPPTPPPPKQPSDNYRFFIPKGGNSPPPPSPVQPPVPVPLVEVDADFLQKCENQAPDDHLFDPGGALPDPQGETLRRLFEYHAGEASTQASLLLLRENEKLPPRLDLAQIAKGRLRRGHQCLVVYSLGHPLRSRMFMSQGITASVSPSYLQGLLRACVADALQAADPKEQLQRFATQLSIRLIWMERAHPATFAPAPTPDAPPALTKAALPAPAPPSPLAPAPPSAPSWTGQGSIANLRSLWAGVSPLALWLTAGAGVTLLLLLLLVRLVRRRRRQQVWILPETDSKTRLGGPHCGGGGAWIKFG
jgi:hypothetical protein